MKRRFGRIVLVCFMAVTVIACGLYASDMQLELESGITVLLHDDHTWDYTPGARDELKEDISIILDDGNAVNIKKNLTWFYLDKVPEPQATETEYLRTIYSVGTAKGPDLFDVKKAALENAARYLAKQLISSTNDKSLSLDKLQKCIEEEDKKVAIQESKSGKVWQVQINMSMESDQIQFVLDCAKQRED